MKKVFIPLIVALVGAAMFTAAAPAPNKPRPSCPEGYVTEQSSTHNMVLCLKETVRERVVEKVVYRDREVIREVPGPERIVEKIVYVDREVPGPERVVTRTVTKTKIKKVPVVKYKTKIKYKRHTVYVNCPKPPYPPAG